VRNVGLGFAMTTAAFLTNQRHFSDGVIDMEHCRGKLLEVKKYSAANILADKTVFEYTPYNSTNHDILSVRAVRQTAKNMSPAVGRLALQAIKELRASTYLIHTYPVYLLKKTDYRYVQGPSNSAIETTTSYQYDSYSNLIEEKVESADDRSNLTTNYKYAYSSDVTESETGNKQKMIDAFMVGIPLVVENSQSKGSKVEYKDFDGKMLPWISYTRKQTGTNPFIENTRILSYSQYNLPFETQDIGFPKKKYTWANGLLQSKTFGTPNTTTLLTWSINYKSEPYAKRMIDVLTDENGLKTKFYYDGFWRLLRTENRFSGSNAYPENVQATVEYNYHYKGEAIPNNPTPDDVNYNFVSTISTFKGVTAPLSTKQYMDGLGRPIEVVKEFYTPPTAGHTAYWHQKNYVSYDALGRQNKTYLPFENGNLGFQAASTSFNTHPYVLTTFEASPLSRPISQQNVDGTFTYISYGANTAADAVQIMVPASGAGALASASSSSVYAANTLSKTTMTDENGKLTYVFKDKLGRVVLTRKLLNGNSGANVDTYNVYDDYGQLVVVVPPGALTISGASASVINDLTFQYKYDNKNRLSAKKIPGAVAQKFYYDSRDLLVLTQDGNMFAESQSKHLATLYDDIGRVVKTGFVMASPTEGADFTFTPQQIQNMDKLTETIYYPNKSWVKHQGAKVLKSAGISTPTNFVWSYTDRRLTSTFYTGNPGWQGKQHLRYPSVSQNPITDNDSYGVDWSVSDYNGMQQPLYTIRYLFESPSQTGEVRTRQSFVYDNARRLTDVKYAYALFGAGVSDPTYTLSNMVYNHKDQLIEKNIGMNGSNTGALQSIDYLYNVRGWLTNINNVTLNGSGGGSTNSIFTPQSTGSSPIQNLAITPFINKAVQDAVRPYYAANASELPPVNDNNADLFSQVITYGSPVTATGAAGQLNGNISSTVWQVAGRDKQAYGFTYDGLDRLTQANYFDINELYVSPYTSVFSTDNKFKEAVQYDIRGNIIGLQRNGFKNGAWTTNNYTAGEYDEIDNLSYSYDQPSSGNVNKSNTLLRVTDNSLPNKGFRFLNTRPAASDYDYRYDANGNLTYDRHKNITKIEYNYLNLPMKITFGSVATDDYGELYFVYDATGQKHQKIAYVYAGPDLEDVITYDYINGVEYINGYLKRIAHSEGAVVRDAYWVAGTFEHEYVLRDHLGNTRVTFKDIGNDGLITSADRDEMQINHYYPFGLNMEGNWQGGIYNQNKYQYNGKELNQDFGLDWNDYGARFYDPALARWTTVDPLADKYHQSSPYAYVLNRPTIAIDPDGKRVYFIGGAGNDVDGWDYINRWGKAFENQGISFQRVNASHGKFGDVNFTASRRHEFNIRETWYILSSTARGAELEAMEKMKHPKVESQIDKALSFYRNDLKNNPLKEGEQFNLAGYSYGSVMQAQVALQLANEGNVIDNLILIGSPISDKSDLWKDLKSNKNIKNVIRYDIKDDLLSNPQDIWDFMKGAKQNSDDSGPHFNAARPGGEADKLIQTITTWLKQQGVKN
jgi:RHS repeat-associated protein